MGTTTGAEVIVKKLRVVDSYPKAMRFGINLATRLKDNNFRNERGAQHVVRYNFNLDAIVEECPE